MVTTISRRECIHQTTLNCNITPNISSILQRLFHGGITEAARQHGIPRCKMESDSNDAECLPDLESWDDFLASSFDADIIVDDEDEVEG